MTKKKIWLLATCAAAAVAAVPFVPTTFGVGTSNWTQTSETDFKAGTFDNVVATNLGDLKLSRAVRMLLAQNPRVSSVNAMVQAPDGTIYAGTGPHGQLLKIAGDEVTELATIEGATHLFALAMDKDGGLLIGASGENGRVLKLEHPDKKDEKPKELFKAEGVQYIWALTQTSDGKIYAATGPTGKLYEITDAEHSRVVLDCDENNLLSLASDGKDLLYIGTDPNGLVYRVNRKSGDSFVIYDAPEAEISAIVLDKAGNVYAGTSEAREEPVPPKPPGVPTAGRPESQPSGLPIPSKPPTEPEPPKVPDPNPSQPAPIPKAKVEAPKPTESEKPTEKTKPSDSSGPSPGTPGEGKGEGSSADKPNEQNKPKPAEPKSADDNSPAANEPNSATKADESPAQNEPNSPAPAIDDNSSGDKEKTTAEPLGDVETPAQSEPKSDKPKKAKPQQNEPKPAKPKPGPTPPGGTPAPGSAKSSGQRMIPGRQPTVDATGAGQPRPDGNAIYRIDSEGFVTEVFRQRALVLSMVEREGVLFVATGSEGLVYQVSPSAEETIVLAKVDPKQVTCLLPAKDGNIYMGTANVGGIATIGSGFSRHGSYTSTVLDASQISRFGKMQLHGTLPTGTALTVATRSGNVKDATQASWSNWSDAVPAEEFVQVKSPTARFLQYKLAFTSDGDGKTTPVVEDVNIAYQVPNLPPQVKSIKTTAQAEPAAVVPGGDASDAPRVARTPRVQIAWEASDPNSDAMRYTLHFRRGTGAPWILLRENIAETSFDWDTRSVADGRYEIRVTANDSKANPPGKGRSASRVSDPVVVDNTAPLIGSITSKQNGPAVDVKLRVVDRSSIVSAMDYAVDSAKGWQAVLPSDNIFDSPEEAVSFSVPGLSGGSHQITIRAVDAKGNLAFETVVVDVASPAVKSE
jgi:hypothetical protein